MMKTVSRSRWIDYLRSAITVLVVAHHSSLAYTTFAAFDKNAYINSTNPIVDGKRWAGLDIFENFNDIFFMFLMFFISGLFVVKSIQKKGRSHFLKDRMYRLFLPFIAGGTLLMLIAYFPSYYTAHNDTNIIRYVKDFFVVEQWPVGPPWFIWVLFLFNMIIVLIFPFFKRIMEKMANKLSALKNKPILFFFLMYIITWALYVPVAYYIGAGTWTGIGPFDFQLSRIAAYLGYFIFGAIVGCTDFNNEIFSAESPIIRNRIIWGLLALLLYIAITVNGRLHILEQLVINNKISGAVAWMIYYSLYTASCTASCIAFISLFRLGMNKDYKLWDSLSENAYLIYLIHYVFVVWMQFLLLPVNISAFFKFVTVFIVSLALSWLLSNILRRNSFIKKYL